MYTVLVVLAVIVSVLLCFVVLIQESKGGGLSSSFASSNQIMGVRKTTDVVEKATWTLAGLLVVLSVATSYVDTTPEGQKSVVTDMKVTTTPMNLPGQGDANQSAPAATPAAPAPPATPAPAK